LPAAEPAANGAVLWAIGEHHRQCGDVASLGPLVEMIAASARWIERQRHKSRRRRGPGEFGLVIARRRTGGDGPESSYADSLWSLRGLLDAAFLLKAAGEGEAAVTAESWAVALRCDLDASFARLDPSGHPELAVATVAPLIGCSPLGLYPLSHPAMAAAADAIRAVLSGTASGLDCLGDRGFLARLTLRLGAVELQSGDRRVLDRLAWVAESASDTFTWAGGGHGQDLATTAEFCSFARDLLVREVPGGLALCGQLPEAWWGQALEVHDAPSPVGLLSFAIRWHGERPALLWELRPRQERPVRLSAPGLDPRWTTTEKAGEVLLGPLLGPDR
jgi:hypothetical protein